jgi:predicted RNA-binding protein with TRAM domain
VLNLQNLLEFIMSGKTQKMVQRLQMVRIDDVAAEGKCLIRTDEGVIFVEGRSGGPVAAPGDVVDIRIVNRKSNTARLLLKKCTPSGRVVPNHFVPILAPVAVVNGSTSGTTNSSVLKVSRCSIT